MRQLIILLALALTPLSLFARQTEPLDAGWRFVRDDVPGAAAADFDDSTWTQLLLPHTWNAADATGGKQKYHRGPAWYRRHITLTADQAGKSVFLWFGAAGSAAEVFVNGKSIGTHKGAFSAFCFDASPHVVAGDNVVAVRVTNVHDTQIAPLSGDFNILGGLYRDAKLIVTDRLCISPLDFASSGVQIRQTSVTDAAAELKVTTHVRNAGNRAQPATVRFTLRDAGNTAVAILGTQAEFEAGATEAVTLTATIPNPHLWNGRADPYLYTATVEVRINNNVVDSITTPVGLRSYKFDPQQGFILNGKPYRVHGVNRHQDLAGKGWAIGLADMQRDVDLILELGCTGVRLAHYQHSPKFYELCDRAGLIVWAEVGLVNTIDFSPEFAEVTKQQLTELIKQAYNHPSIVTWCLWNELSARAGNPETPKQLDLVRQMNDLAHQLDPTRPTTAASHKPVAFEGNWITDLIGFNRYWGWYYGKPEDWGAELDKMHAARPDRAIGISEWGAGASIHHHEADRAYRPRTSGRWHPEEWQAKTFEHAWRAMNERPWLWGTFVWNFADFAAEGRVEGDAWGINDKGLVTYDRQVKKDAFYYLKANWSNEPVLYIASRRFTPRPQTLTQIKVYSNRGPVTLNVNGREVGTVTPTDDRIAIWNDVELQQGENSIAVTAERDGERWSDEVTIIHDPSATTQPSP